MVTKFVKDTGLLDHVTGVDINRRGYRFKGYVAEMYEHEGKQYGNVVFEVAPDLSIGVLLTCLKFEGVRPRRAPEQDQQVQPDMAVDSDLLDDAIQEVIENDIFDEDDEDVVVDENWREGDVFVDERATDLSSEYRAINHIINMNSAAFSSPAA